MKKYLVCVDSDGCAMNTMDIKHKRCFGPCLIAEWGLQQWQTELLTFWNDLNLYSKTRGINRFKGLAITLNYVNLHCKSISGIDEFFAWAQNADELSNKSLKQKIENGAGECFQKALDWSVSLNAEIDKLTSADKLPFCGVEEALRVASASCDIAIVSSANRSSVEEEWQRCGLLQYTCHTMTQENGGKAACIARLLNSGYNPSFTLMVGDAVGDLQAAIGTGVKFFPILVGHESQSWQKFLSEGLPHLLDGTFEKYQNALVDEFDRNFK